MRAMSEPVLVCVDGSELSIEAARAGLAVVDASAEIVVVTAVSENDPMLVTGSGFVGGTMTAGEFEDLEARLMRAGQETVDAAAKAIGRDARTVVLDGSPGHAICAYATESGARAIVIGSRGHGGLKRGVLGSVSDHVVRNAPCPVIVTPPSD